MCRQWRALVIPLVQLALGALPGRAAPQPIDYALDLRQPQLHLIHVTMTVPAASPSTTIQFPAWNNLYQIRDFVHDVQELEASCDASPEELTHLDLNTWQTGPQPCSRLEVRYAVYANDDSIFSAVLNEEHAFLNFALLLFYLPKERERSARVKFLLPAGWKLATALPEDEDEFTAPNYDRLVDSPAEAGKFQQYEYRQSGATYRIIVHADPAEYSADRLLTSIEKITATETAMMGEAPFSRFTFFFHFSRPGRGGGMEHREGTAISFPAGRLARDWGYLEATIAHEFFHLWNVKRIRPQGLEPIDYVRGNDTCDLWFSEGVTSYYQELTLLRAGLVDRKRFYDRLAGEIERLQERPGRWTQSLEESGREAWLEKYPDYHRPERGISYYNKGALLGLLLDLAMRHATGNQSGLDDLMRAMNDDFAHRGRYFTESDLRREVGRLAPGFRNVDAFFQDYLFGKRELDYETYLDYAGLRFLQKISARPALGFRAVQVFDDPAQVQSVESGSSAEKAGLERGDGLLRLNNQPLTGVPDDVISGMNPGEKIRLQVRRGGRTLEIEFLLGSRTATEYRVEEIRRPAPDQLQVRTGWLEGSSGSRVTHP